MATASDLAQFAAVLFYSGITAYLILGVVRDHQLFSVPTASSIGGPSAWRR